MGAKNQPVSDFLVLAGVPDLRRDDMHAEISRRASSHDPNERRSLVRLAKIIDKAYLHEIAEVTHSQPAVVSVLIQRLDIEFRTLALIVQKSEGHFIAALAFRADDSEIGRHETSFTEQKKNVFGIILTSANQLLEQRMKKRVK